MNKEQYSALKKNFKEYQEYLKKCKENNRIRREKLKAENPEKLKEYNTRKCREWRNNNRQKYRDSQKDAQKKWLKDPVNLKSHKERNWANRVKVASINSPKSRFNYIADFYRLAHSQDKVVNHIISIRDLLEFNIDMPKEILHHPVNLEKITLAENSQKRNFVTNEVLHISVYLEAHFPEFCEGLFKFLREKVEK